MRDRSALDQLLDDLRRRVCHSRDVEMQGMHIRKFLETTHKAMGKLLGFNSDKVHVDSWTEWMAKAASNLGGVDEVHTEKYGILTMIATRFYRQGNIPAHENKEVLLITTRRCIDNCEDLARLIPILNADMQVLHLDLEAAILRGRETATHLHRAQHLLDAMTSHVANDPTRLEGELWPTVELILRSVDAKLADGVRRDPSIHSRLKRAVVDLLSQRASGKETCILRELARALPPSPEREKWLVSDAAHIAMLAAEPRLLPLLRLCVDVDDHGPGYAVRSCTFHDEFGAQWPVGLPGVPEYESEQRLYLIIKQLFSTAARAQHARTATAHVPHDVVLQLAVRSTAAMHNYEAFKPLGPMPNLAEEFFAVVVDPLDENDSPAELVEPLDSTRMALVWQGNPNEVRRLFRGHLVFLAGPPAWRAEIDGKPPILWAMSQRAAAVLLPEYDEALALQNLGLDDWDRTGVNWADLVERIADLKRGPGGAAPGAYRIFLNDLRYSTFLGQSS